jgi:hypothetical protein
VYSQNVALQALLSLENYMKQMKNTDLEASITHLSHSLEKGVGSLNLILPNIIWPLNVVCIAWLFLEFSPRTSEDRKPYLQECPFQLG